MRLKDKFGDRLIIPIANHQGQIAGFTGRVLPYDTSDRPKYLNSSDSEWFRKGNMWFGWTLAKNSIRERSLAIIVEGNMDVIACHVFGLTNVLASQGTAVTQDQLKQLKMLTKTIWLAFDNDNAGRISSNKLFVLAQEFGFEVNKVIIPEKYKDLDEYLNNEFAQNQEPIQLENIPYLDYLLTLANSNLRHSNSNIQREALLSFMEILVACDTITIEQYINKLSTITSISHTTLSALIEEKSKELEKQKTYLSKYTTNIDSSEEKTEDSTPVSTFRGFESSEDQIYLAVWQKICALSYSGKLLEEYRSKMFYLLNLLSKILNQLSEFKSVENYISSNKDLLDLIISDTEFDTNGAYQRRLWNSLVQFVDRNHQMFILDNQTKEFFRQFKNK